MLTVNKLIAQGCEAIAARSCGVAATMLTGREADRRDRQEVGDCR